MDFETGTKVLSLLDKLIRKAGKTLIMATHSRDVESLHNPRFIRIEKGKLIV